MEWKTAILLLLLASAATAFLACDEHLGQCGSEEEHETVLVRLLPPEVEKEAADSAEEEVNQQPSAGKVPVDKSDQQDEKHQKTAAAGNSGKVSGGTPSQGIKESSPVTKETVVRAGQLTSALGKVIQAAQPKQEVNKPAPVDESKQTGAKILHQQKIVRVPIVTSQVKAVPSQKDSRPSANLGSESNANANLSIRSKRQTVPELYAQKKLKEEEVNKVATEQAKDKSKIKYVKEVGQELKTKDVDEKKKVEVRKPASLSKVVSTQKSVASKDTVSVKKVVVPLEIKREPSQESNNKPSSKVHVREGNLNTITRTPVKKEAITSEIRTHKGNLSSDRSSKDNGGASRHINSDESKPSAKKEKEETSSKENVRERVKRFRSSEESRDAVKTEEKNLAESNPASYTEKGKTSTEAVSSKYLDDLDINKSNLNNTRKEQQNKESNSRKNQDIGNKHYVDDSGKYAGRNKKEEVVSKVIPKVVNNGKPHLTNANISAHQQVSADRKRRDTENYRDIVQVPEIVSSGGKNSENNFNASIKNQEADEPSLNNSEFLQKSVIVDGKLFKVADSKKRELRAPTFNSSEIGNNSNSSIVNRKVMYNESEEKSYITTQNDTTERATFTSGKETPLFNQNHVYSEENLTINKMTAGETFQRKKRDAGLTNQAQSSQNDKSVITYPDNNVTVDSPETLKSEFKNEKVEEEIKEFSEDTTEYKSSEDHEKPSKFNTTNSEMEVVNEEKQKESVAAKNGNELMLHRNKEMNDKQNNSSEEPFTEDSASESIDHSEKYPSPSKTEPETNLSSTSVQVSKLLKQSQDGTEEVTEKQVEVLEIRPLVAPVLKENDKAIIPDELRVDDVTEGFKNLNVDGARDTKKVNEEMLEAPDKKNLDTVPEEDTQTSNKNPADPVVEKLLMNNHSVTDQDQVEPIAKNRVMNPDTVSEQDPKTSNENPVESIAEKLVINQESVSDQDPKTSNENPLEPVAEKLVINPESVSDQEPKKSNENPADPIVERLVMNPDTASNQEPRTNNENSVDPIVERLVMNPDTVSEQNPKPSNENQIDPIVERLMMNPGSSTEEINQPVKIELAWPLEKVPEGEIPPTAQPLVLMEQLSSEGLPRISQRDRDGGRRSVDETEEDMMEPPQLRFPTVPDGETFHSAKLGLSDGIFFFSFLATFISWLQPSDFPVELLRDTLWNRLSVMDLINETLHVEAGFIAVLVVGVLLALAVPLTALIHACCRLMDARNESCDREPTACRRRSLLCGLWTVVALMAVGVAGMLLSNEQVSSAVTASPRVLHTALSDTSAYVRSAHQQIAFVTTKSLDQALAAATEDLDDADALLGLPIQRALSRDTGVDVALDALSDVSAAAEDASERAAAVLEQAAQTRGLALVARERLSDLRYQLDAARRQCASRDRPLCDTVDASGLDVSLRLETLLADDRLQALRDLRGGNLSAAAQQARADFQLLPRQVLESTREARVGIRRELVRERARLQDELNPLEWFARTVASRVDDARAAAQGAATFVQDVDQWRWLVGLGCALAMLLIWLLLAIGASCGCCGSKEKARPVLFTAVVTASLLSLALWAVALFAFLLGGHGEVLVCRPLFTEPEYPQLTRLLDRPGVLFSAGGGGGFFKNVAGNGSLDVPLRDVLQDCELGRPAYPALQLRQLFDVDRAIGEGGRWDGVRTQVSRLEVRLAELRVLTPGLQQQLEATLRAAAANLTQHRLAMAGPVTARDLQALADQLVSVSSQVADLSSASRLETLAARARRLLSSHVTPLEQRKEDLVYRLTALEVALSPLQRQANQSLSHLKTIQYFVVQQGDAIARAAVRRYSDRLLSYLQQAREHVTGQVGRFVAPCRPLFDAFHAARQLACKHALDPLNGMWFSAICCLVLLVAATPLSLHLADAYKRRDASSSLLGSRSSEWQVETNTKDDLLY